MHSKLDALFKVNDEDDDDEGFDTDRKIHIYNNSQNCFEFKFKN